MSTARCPTCKATLLPLALATTAPFCSQRCKLADLGSWLDGRYAIADTTTGPEELEALLEASLTERAGQHAGKTRGRSRS